ncbi:MAG: class I SAM-dependent methyltransferase [Hydrogenobaculum sp.]
MNLENLANIFDSISGAYDKFVGFISLGQNKEWHKSIAHELKPGNLLDIGTATGDVIFRAFEQNKIKTAFGIDLSIKMLKIAKQKLKGKPAYLFIASAEHMPFKDGVFDNISMSLVFRHIIDKDSMLKEINRVLRKGGRFIVLDTTKFIGMDFFAKISKTFLRPLGVAIFGNKNWDFFIHSLENSLSTEEVKNLCESYGLRLINKKLFIFGMVGLLVFEKP